MTKVDIVSGFLGAGKTTLIKKLLAEALQGEQVVLIENEFGEIGIDGGFLKESGIEIREMNSGCICCSLVGDFGKSLEEVLHTYHPDRIIIEPSGVGKLSDVIAAVIRATKGEDVVLNSTATVVDASKARMYMKNFGEFFNNQIESAGTIVLSRTATCGQKKLDTALEMIRALNEHATIITTPWEKLTGVQMLETLEKKGSLEEDLMREVEEQVQEEEHSHHDHEEECCGHDHEGHHHHHHDADEIFTSWGFETPRSFTVTKLDEILTALGDEEQFGLVLRAKGMVPAADGQAWLYFDMVPEEKEIREGEPQVTGKVCVIGSGIRTDALTELFGA